MKNRKKRFCLRCDCEVKIEKTVPNYPFYCPGCDENKFRFETKKSEKKNK